jgi:co-chaperonin GroES (HSP10)
MLQVVGQRILVKPDNLEHEAKLGDSGVTIQIVRPGDLEKAERNATDIGTVVQLSEIAYLDIADGTKWCEVGDRIIYAKHSGKWITDPDTQEEFYAIRDEDVQAVIK